MWQVVATANFVCFVAYIAIAAAIVLPLVAEGQLGTNRLGTATAAIFFTCAVHHGMHSVHMVLPVFGIDTAQGHALRTAVGTWHSVAWDALTALVGVYYWTLRRTYGTLMRGAKLFEDMRERQQRALEINDNIVQGLYVAQTALALDEVELSEEALRGTLAAARNIISDLLGERDTALAPGELVRQTAAVVTAGDRS
jgi:hypothetical protein